MALELPSLFLQSVTSCAGFDESAFIEAHQHDALTSIRINPFKKTELNLEIESSVPWNNEGFYLKERPNFTNDVLFQAGCYYVQEAGSMFIQHALTSCVDFNNSLQALDLCASPGGKSTLLNSLLNERSLLVANEISKQRADVLCQNLTKWGTSNVVVTNNDPSAFSEIENEFDVVLIDAPCSGSGLFRKQHDAVDEWSIDNVNLCSSRQKRILSDVLPSLASNGVLVYSTCSYSEQENEDIVDWLISEFDLISVKIPVDKSWGIVESLSKIHQANGYRFYPNKTKSEGFFCAVLKKQNSELKRSQSHKKKYTTFTPLSQKEKLPFDNWIKQNDQHVIIPFKDDFLLTNNLGLEFINKYKNIYLKKVGTNCGSLLKAKLNPHHDLALSIHLSDSVEKADCTDEELILYLKKTLQSINSSSGWVLVHKNNFGLGWIKQLGNRFNNYLPNEFRILK